MDDLDARLAAALERWVMDNREVLRLRGVTVLLDGPQDPMGMDAVYLLRLDSARGEAEATLFRGGTLLLARVNKADMALQDSHVNAATEPDLTAALNTLTDDV